MGEQGSDNLKKGIILVFIANFINLVISLMNGFILPKYLSVDTYADIKTYQLYANYIGVLALGYSDGIYLKFGGYKISNISNNEINTSRTNLLVFQGILSLFFVGFAWFINDNMLLFAAITVVPVNIASVFKNILQATGEFKAYSRIINYTSILTFVGTIILLFVVETDNELLYVGLMALVTFIVWILLERKLHSTYSYVIRFVFSLKNLAENIKSGIVLMLGNLSSILMTSIDRWFVKALLTTTDFAYYSFVVSAENLVAIFINPVVTTMYNYICVNRDYKALVRIKKMCMIFALYLVSGAFLVKFVLEIYLTKYIESRYVLFVLFSTEILFIIIKGIYVNVYKAEKKQDVYFKQLIIAIILGCVFNAIFYMIFGSNEGIAFATLLSVACWYIICSATVKELKPNCKEILVLIVSIITYICFGFFLPSILGFVLYLLVITLLCALLMKSELISLIKMCTRMINSRIKR